MNSKNALAADLDPTDLLRRIGWQHSDWAQIEACARLSPAQKITEMLQLRGEAVRLLKVRLKREHPECDDRQLEYLVQEHLDWVREASVGG